MMWNVNAAFGFLTKTHRDLLFTLAICLTLQNVSYGSPYSDLIETYNPVAYWRLGESSGSTANDETTNYDGTYVGPLLNQPGAIKGDANKAAEFDGADDYVDVGTPVVSGSALSIIAWIKPHDGVATSRGILAKKRIWTTLFVVVNTGSLTAQETARKDLMESWGYQVNLIAASASQTSFNTAVASADVAYVSNEISASSLGTKLKSASIGVLNEKAELADDFGVAGNIVYRNKNSVRILNSAHYITTGYTVGNDVTILSPGTESMSLLDNNLASGLSELAETTKTGQQYRTSLATLEVGASLYGGGTAAGRRVELPWGKSGFDFDKLNADGLNIMRRSIDWAAGRTSAAADTDRHSWAIKGTVAGGNFQLEFVLRAGGSTSELTADTGSFAPNKWMMVMAVYDGSTMKLYKNDTEVGSMAKSGALDTTAGVPTWIGNTPASSSSSPWGAPFDGRIDEVAIIDQALTPADILALSEYKASGVRILKWVEVK